MAIDTPRDRLLLHAAETTVSACASTEVAAGAGRAAFVASGTVGNKQTNAASNDVDGACERSYTRHRGPSAADLLGAQTPASDANDALWDAARSGDTAIAAVLDKGVDVNAKARAARPRSSLPPTKDTSRR